MSIMDFIKGTSGQQQQQEPAQQQQQAPQNPGNDPVNQFTGANGNPNSTNQQQNQRIDPSIPQSMQRQFDDDPEPQQQQQNQKSPLEELEELFNNATTETPNPNDPNAQQPQQDDPNAPLFDLNNVDKVRDILQKQNFVSGENVQDLMQKAMGGDGEAMMNLLNTVARNTMVENARFNGAMGNQMAAEIISRIEKQLPNKLREYRTQETVGSANELYQNRAVRPIVDSLRQQFMQKYPDATPQQVSQAVDKAFSTLVTEASKSFAAANQQPQQTDRRNAGPTGETDFSLFFPG